MSSFSFNVPRFIQNFFKSVKKWSLTFIWNFLFYMTEEKFDLNEEARIRIFSLSFFRVHIIYYSGDAIHRDTLWRKHRYVVSQRNHCIEGA